MDDNISDIVSLGVSNGTALLRENPKLIHPFILSSLGSLEFKDLCDWLNCLITNPTPGSSVAESVKKVQANTKKTICGFIWETGYIAYRCRTCGLSPCSAICHECFQNGPHRDHNYLMYKSVAGGCCDCGDPGAWKPSGYCCNHTGPDHAEPISMTDDELIVCYCTLRCVLWYVTDLLNQDSQTESRNLQNQTKQLLSWLQTTSEYGDSFRRILCAVIVEQPELLLSSASAQRLNQDILQQSGSQTSSLLEALVAAGTFLPFELCTLYLQLLFNFNFKTQFTTQFIYYYKNFILDSIRFSTVSAEDDAFDKEGSTRMIDISVQLFSNSALTLKMLQSNDLLSVIFDCINFICVASVRSIGTEGEEEDEDPPKQVNTEHPFFAKRAYSPMMNDLTNIFSHQCVTLEFLTHPNQVYIKEWLQLLRRFQRMDLQRRQFTHHVEYDNRSWAVAFFAEWELVLEQLALMQTAVAANRRNKKGLAAAHSSSLAPEGSSLAPEGSSLAPEGSSSVAEGSSLIPEGSSWVDLYPHLLSIVHNGCQVLAAHIREQPGVHDVPVSHRPISFHLPLHRFLANFLSELTILEHENFLEQPPQHERSFFDLLPEECLNADVLLSMIEHPLELQVVLAQSRAGMWRRNGDSFYKRCWFYRWSYFYDFGFDLDLFLVQVAACLLAPNDLIEAIITKFNLTFHYGLNGSMESFFDKEESSFSRIVLLTVPMEHVMSLNEDLLLLLTALLMERCRLGASDEECIAEEIQSRLFVKDMTHSQLSDNICRRWIDHPNFEQVLSSVASFQEPKADKMDQGKFRIKDEMWSPSFNWPHLLIRSTQRSEYENALARFSQNHKEEPSSTSKPLNMMRPLKPLFRGITALLHSAAMHHVIVVCLHNAVHHTGSDRPTAVSISLLCILLESILDDLENVNACHSRLPSAENKGVRWLYSSNDIRVNAVKPIGTRRITMLALLQHLAESNNASDSRKSLVRVAIRLQEAVVIMTNENNTDDSTNNKNNNEDSMVDVDSLSTTQQQQQQQQPLTPTASSSAMLPPSPPCKAASSSLSALNPNVASASPRLVCAKSLEEEDAERAKAAKQSARERQAAVLAAFAQKQAQFAEFMLDEDMDDLDEEMQDKEAETAPSEEEYPIAEDADLECAVCSEAVLPSIVKPLGMVCFVQRSGLLGIAGEGECMSIGSADGKEQHDWTMGLSPGISPHIQSCGHYIHPQCFTAYFESMWRSQAASDGPNLGIGEFVCPMCRAVANCLLPIIPKTVQKRCFSEVDPLLQPHLASLDQWIDTNVAEEDSSGSGDFSDVNICGEGYAAMNLPYSPGISSSSYSGSPSTPPVAAMLDTDPLLSALNTFTAKVHKVGFGESGANPWHRLFALWATLRVNIATTELAIRGNRSCSRLSSWLRRQTTIRRLVTASWTYHTLQKMDKNVTSFQLERMVKVLTGQAIGTAMPPPLSKSWLLADDKEPEPPPQQPRFFIQVDVGLDEPFSVAQMPSSSLSFSHSSNPNQRRSARELICGGGLSSGLPLLALDLSVFLQRMFLLCPQILSSKQRRTAIITVILQAGITQFALSNAIINHTAGPTHTTPVTPIDAQLINESITSVVKEAIAYLKNKDVSIIGLPTFITNAMGTKPSDEASSSSSSPSLPSSLLPILRRAVLMLSSISGDDDPTSRAMTATTLEEEWNLLLSDLQVGSLSTLTTHPLMAARARKWLYQWAKYVVKLDESYYPRAVCPRWVPAVVPSLIELPKLYHDLFKHYRFAECDRCGKLPEQPALCLICGQVLCLGRNSSSSSSSSHGECFLHAQECGAGTGITIVLKTSVVLIIRNERRCVWGSPYLDSFGEEDVELKRGKPLYLNAARYNQLTFTWLAHAFDHEQRMNNRWSPDAINF